MIKRGPRFAIPFLQASFQLLFKQTHIVCSAENIVNRDPVKIRKYHKMLNGYCLKTAFVSRIYGLACVYKVCDLGLVHIVIFSQVTKSLKIHNSSPLVLIGTIDFITFICYNLHISTF